MSVVKNVETVLVKEEVLMPIDPKFVAASQYCLQTSLYSSSKGYLLHVQGSITKQCRSSRGSIRLIIDGPDDTRKS